MRRRSALSRRLPPLAVLAFLLPACTSDEPPAPATGPVAVPAPSTALPPDQAPACGGLLEALPVAGRG